MSPSSPPAPLNPTHQWRFTWEAQSHVPTLRLHLFSPSNPIPRSTPVVANLLVEHFIIALTVPQNNGALVGNVPEATIRVPVPRVLIDFEAPVICRAFDNHIEAKLVLLLPVDHLLLSDFDSATYLSDIGDLSSNQNADSDELRPLSMDYDLKKLSTMEEVYFYCRSCSAKLTTALRSFEEMPSVDWPDVADNWFGGCCCSFGGVSEKLVMRFAKSYNFEPGVCLLSTTSALICKDDLVGCKFSNFNGSKRDAIELNSAGGGGEAVWPNKSEQGDSVLCKNQRLMLPGTKGDVRCPCPEEDHLDINFNSIAVGKVIDCDESSCLLPEPDTVKALSSSSEICTECCPHKSSEPNLMEQMHESNSELLENQKSFLNGYLGSGFMARSSGISKDVKWMEFLCPQCSHLLGVYPCSDDQAPLDGRVRLFKCYISTSLPVGGSEDFFKNYTLEKMFISQLLESAKDELTFRTIVRDLQTHDAVMQIILLNPNLWCCIGSCSDSIKPAPRMDMHPAVKVLYSACNDNAECGSRKLEEWVSNKQVEEVYMLPAQIEELIATMEQAKHIYPSSDSFLQDFFVSSMKR